jgi:hypothetical protein
VAIAVISGDLTTGAASPTERKTGDIPLLASEEPAQRASVRRRSGCVTDSVSEGEVAN